MPHLPAGGEIVLFDRSWYNRAGVERVMGFASEDQVEEFFRDVPEFERMLVRSGITLIKYWFSITDEEQQLRFLMRIHDPMKQWKLTPMDLQSRVRWEALHQGQGRDVRAHQHPRGALVHRRGQRQEAGAAELHRTTCCEQIPYERRSRTRRSTLPERVFNPDYERKVLPRRALRAEGVLRPGGAEKPSD